MARFKDWISKPRVKFWIAFLGIKVIIIILFIMFVVMFYRLFIK